MEVGQPRLNRRQCSSVVKLSQRRREEKCQEKVIHQREKCFLIQYTAVLL